MRRSTVGRALRGVATTTVQRARRVADGPELRRWHDEGGPSKRYDYPLGPGDVVLDVGGFDGQWTSDIFGRYLCTIHIFEPVAAFADAIEHRFAANDHVRLHRFGLAGRTTDVDLAVAGDRSSVHRRGPDVEVVTLRRAADALAEIGVDGADLLKVNIEGGEYELLDHLLTRGWMDRVRFLQVQFHDDHPDAAALRGDLHRRLRLTHRPQWIYDFVWESWERRA